MRKSRRMTFIKFTVVVITFSFLFSSIMPFIESSNGSSSSHYEKYHPVSLPEHTSNITSCAGYLEYTLALGNNTLFGGNLNETAKFNKDLVVFDPLNDYLYVTNERSNSIMVINGSENTVIQNISVHNSPVGVTFDQYNGNIYASSFGDNIVTVINASNNSPIKYLPVGRGSCKLVSDPFNGNVYVSNFLSNNVSVINGNTNVVMANINVGFFPDGVAFDPYSSYVYVSNRGSNNISLINASTNKVIGSINLTNPPRFVALDPLNGNLYADTGNDNVTVINGTTNTVIGSFSVGIVPSGITVDPSSGYLYIADSCSHNISVINATTDKVIKNIGVGLYPYGTAYDTSSGFLYVTNDCSGTVSIISTVRGTEPVFPVSFYETGLPAGTKWNVTLNNTASSYAASRITFSVPNGTYSYNIIPDDAYYAVPSSGSVKIDGRSYSIQVTFKQYIKPPPLPVEYYGIIGLIAVILVIGAVLVLIRKRIFSS